MVVFDRLGPVVRIPATEDGAYSEEKAKEYKCSTMLHKEEKFGPADIKAATDGEDSKIEVPEGMYIPK